MKFSLSKFLISYLNELCFLGKYFQISGIFSNLAKWSEMGNVRLPEDTCKRLMQLENIGCQLFLILR